MFIKKLQKTIKNNLPLILVIFISIFIGLQNTSIRAYYSGWDNIHAEFNLQQYSNRVFFGAWQEHQGLGGPAAKGHLSEITRLPILYILQLIFPNYLVRSSFIFLMYTIGGIGMYLYLKKIWIKKILGQYGKWLAGLGSLLYLLHPLTLQQFYISFEIFTIQFAFFPFLLLSIHSLIKKITWKSVLIFMLVQLALAPSAHTPTVHYLGVIFSLIYAFFFALDTKKFVSAIKFSFFIGLLTLLMNSYWILPNLYYGFHNSSYVAKSEVNILFGPDSLWSIRESNTINSFLTGFHYLITWKDYNFESNEHELIFNEWTNHFANPFRTLQMHAIGISSILGFIVTIFNKKIGKGRWAIVTIYAICVTLIWIELFPTKNIILNFYNSKTFLEAFRNPFTKLSILYSFFLVVLFIEFILTLIKIIKKKLVGNLRKIIVLSILSITSIYIVSITAPIFSGNLISEKLKVIYPLEYQKLYSYMKTKNKDTRVLEMPYISREGWVLYDWSTPTNTNAYQGIGFYFFGLPQPFLTTDFARWSEVNDFFYQELQYAVDKKDHEQFKQITKKYHVPLAIVDESREIPYKEHNFEADHKLLVLAGFEKVWEEKFISVYENTENSNNLDNLIIPKSLDFVSANLDRVKKDVAFLKVGSYINTDEVNNDTKYIFPFTNLLSKEIPDAIFGESGVLIEKSIPKNDYLLEIPGINEDTDNITIALQLKNNILSVSFPQYTLIANNKKIPLFSLDNTEIPFEENILENSILINEKRIILSNDETKYLSLYLTEDQDKSISFSSDKGKLLFEYILDWENLKKETKIELNELSILSLKTSFPIAKANLSKIPSENCTLPILGEVQTTYKNESAIYKANNYGVNCNTLDLGFLTPSSSYLLNIDGENFAGRSIKMFINYSIENTIQEEHLFTESKFNTTIPLDEISSDPLSKFFVNWETRSFGKESENKINNISAVPFPLEQFSQISLTKTDGNNLVNNDIEIISSTKHQDFYYSLVTECPNNNCYLGIDQAFDDLWIAYDKQSNKILTHSTYNNWANIWKIENGTSEIFIIYIPQIVALLGMSLVVISISTAIIYSFRNRKKIKPKSNLKKKIQKSMQGNNLS